MVNYLCFGPVGQTILSTADLTEKLNAWIAKCQTRPTIISIQYEEIRGGWKYLHVWVWQA